MSSPDNQSWGNPPTIIVALIVIIFLIWIFGGRHFFRSTGHDIRTAAHDAGQDIKDSAHDLGDSMKR